MSPSRDDNPDATQQETTMPNIPHSITAKPRKSLIAPWVFMALYIATFAVFALAAVISRDHSLFACAFTGLVCVLMHGRWKE